MKTVGLVGFAWLLACGNMGCGGAADDLHKLALRNVFGDVVLVDREHAFLVHNLGNDTHILAPYPVFRGGRISVLIPNAAKKGIGDLAECNVNDGMRFIKFYRQEANQEVLLHFSIRSRPASGNDREPVDFAPENAPLATEEGDGRPTSVTGTIPEYRITLDATRVLLDTPKVNTCLAPERKEYVLDTIAGMLPKKTNDLLFHYYGLNKNGNRRWVDLEAGMRLRVEYSNYTEPLMDKAQNPGYVGSGVAFFELVRRRTADGAKFTFSLSPFLGLMEMTGQPAGTTSTDVETYPDWAVGSVDFEHSLPSTYWRLMYEEKTFHRAWVANQSPPLESAKNAVIAIAESREKLEGLTNGKCPNRDDPNTPSGVRCLMFRERGVVIPEVPITVRGIPTFVPIGTTLRNVLDQFERLDDPSPWTKYHVFNSLRIARRYNGKSYLVQFAGIDNPDTQLDKYLDLPLVKGDMLAW